ncbi:hypothetical protein B0H11DRAFT_2403625 [Mycena galericulata]|nr:hypothetical protein B0H11DRAFT_2403625 [Mycena galericulata]
MPWIARGWAASKRQHAIGSPSAAVRTGGWCACASRGKPGLSRRGSCRRRRRRRTRSTREIPPREAEGRRIRGGGKGRGGRKSLIIGVGVGELEPRSTGRNYTTHQKVSHRLEPVAIRKTERLMIVDQPVGEITDRTTVFDLRGFGLDGRGDGNVAGGLGSGAHRFAPLHPSIRSGSKGEDLKDLIARSSVRAEGVHTRSVDTYRNRVRGNVRYTARRRRVDCRVRGNASRNSEPALASGGKSEGKRKTRTNGNEKKGRDGHKKRTWTRTPKAKENQTQKKGRRENRARTMRTYRERKGSSLRKEGPKREEKKGPRKDLVMRKTVTKEGEERRTKGLRRKDRRKRTPPGVYLSPRQAFGRL